MNNHDTMKERAQYSGNHIGVLFGRRVAKTANL